MSEIAMVTARKTRLKSQAKRGDKAAKRVLKLAKDPGRFLSTVQIGITLIGILMGIYSGDKIKTDLQKFLDTIDWISPYSETVSVVIILAGLTYFSLLLGELVPKRIGLTLPVKVSKTFALPMNVLSIVASPFIWFLTISSDLLLRILRIQPGSGGRITEEEIKAIIDEGTREGAIDVIEQDIVERVFNMGDRKVASLMTHRTNVTTLRLTDNAGRVRKVVDKNLHSVYPVLDPETGKLAGVVKLKLLFRHIDEPDFELRKLIREPQYFTENMSAYQALRKFKVTNIHHAIVIDEFGEFEGVLTLQDLLEALVGDVSDFESEEFSFVKRDDGSLLVDGQYPLADFMHRLELDDMIQDYPFNTISGLILHEMNSVPNVGDVLDWQKYRIEIMDMDGARIDKVLVYKHP